MQIDKKSAEKYFNSFNKLCDKAKELIFVDKYTKSDYQVSFFDVCDIEDFVTELSPIEQILYVAINIYEIDSKKTFMLSLESQSKIVCDKNTYIADFLINNIYVGHDECKLKKPIVIECDGYDFHNTKLQVNKDYKRENTLKLTGYDIIRFTGSQIYNSPFECAAILFEYIEKVVKSKEHNMEE